MTTARPQPVSSATPAGPAFVRIPDPPERYPDDMTSFIHLTETGSVAYLIDHFSNPDTTVIGGELYLQPDLHTPQSERRTIAVDRPGNLKPHHHPGRRTGRSPAGGSPRAGTGSRTPTAARILIPPSSTHLT